MPRGGGGNAVMLSSDVSVNVSVRGRHVNVSIRGVVFTCSQKLVVVVRC